MRDNDAHAPTPHLVVGLGLLITQ